MSRRSGGRARRHSPTQPPAHWPRPRPESSWWRQLAAYQRALELERHAMAESLLDRLFAGQLPAGDSIVYEQVP